jgi:site-specific DNA-adenine methylase
MGYVGGKHNQAKRITELFKPFNDGRTYFEPFLGGASVAEQVHKFWTGPMVLSDINQWNMVVYLAVGKGLINGVFSVVDKAEWSIVKQAFRDGERSLDVLIKILAVGQGKGVSGCTCGKRADNYCAQAERRWRNQQPVFQRAKLRRGDYRKIVKSPHGSLIYLDPPYKSASSNRYQQPFNYEEFWDQVRVWSRDNVVFVSELDAPEDFEVVLSIPKTTTLNFPSCKKVSRYNELVWRMK